MPAFDFRKEYREFYLPPDEPELIEVPEFRYIAVRGKGNPNDEDGEYASAMTTLYGIAFTLKMSGKSGHEIDGFFDYVVPPLEGFWWQKDTAGIDRSRKEDFCWISLIRLPDFITRDEFDWAVKTASDKKKRDFSSAEYFVYSEGLCVQCMHHGPFDSEDATTARMAEFADRNGCDIDITDTRYHHEIYLSDARRTKTENLRTVIRHPVKRR